MDHLEGADLAEILRRRALGDTAERLELMAQICDGVAAAHRRDLIHQDLKPGNVYRLPDGRVKILDFGLARLSASPRTSRELAGTPQYMSPEPIGGAPPDARPDVFALGALFFELLTGRRCFPAETFEAIFFQVLHSQPESARSFEPSLPGLADRILAKALAKEPEARFADAEELAGTIDKLRCVVAGECAESAVAAVLGLVAAPQPESPPSRPAVEVPEARPEQARPDRARVTFAGEDGVEREVIADCRQPRTLLELSCGAGIPHFHECGGHARCSTCRVRVEAGSDGLMPPTRAEANLAGRLGWGGQIRLACQAKVVGDVEVQRLVHDTRAFGLLRFENRHAPPRETALAALAVTVRNLPKLLKRSVPYDAVHGLNRFYLEVGKPILAAGGCLDESKSDGLVALFGLEGGTVADKCRALTLAALRVRSRLSELARYTRAYFDFELETGLAIDFGRTVLGHLGHPSQMRPTAVGGFTAAAQELAASDELEGGRILATEALVNVLEGELRFEDLLVADSATPCYEILEFLGPTPS